MKKRAVFFDRDGTLSHEVGYVNHLSRFQPFSFAADAIRAVNAAGWLAIVVTNQAGVARGYFPESLIAEVNGALTARVESGGARIDAIYYCPHHPSAGVPPYRQDCDCRKPKPGMLRRAAEEHGVDLEKSWVVGDREGDLRLSWSVGGRACLVRTGYGAGEIEYWMKAWERQPDLVAENALEAALRIVE